MNNNIDLSPTIIELDSQESKSSDDYQSQNGNKCLPSGKHVSHSSIASGSGTGITSHGTKRHKDLSPCYVCGAKAHGYNFDQITCESCKAFFRRNALKSMDKFRCRNNDKCVITSATRKRCKRCRLKKCFDVGMRKEWILTEEEKQSKRRKIEENRLIKQQAQLAIHQRQHQHSDMTHSINTQKDVPSLSTIEQSSILKSQCPISNESCELGSRPLSIMRMRLPLDRQMYESQYCLLKQLSDGYQLICRQYPQPKKFAYYNALISQTIDMDSRLNLVKDLTRELTQMTTSRLLNYFALIPEFRLLTKLEKKFILIKNMLPVFMFHGALTYDGNNNTFVDRTTDDQPYDARYLLFVYGSRVYNNFIALARKLTSVTYQLSSNKESDERGHMLFLLLTVILLFSDGFESGFEIYPNEQGFIDDESNQSNVDQSTLIICESASSLSLSSSSLSSSSSVASFMPTPPRSPSKLKEKLCKIQQNYIEIACRYLHDEFGLAVGRQMFQKLVPVLYDLQNLCATLSNVNLCESAENADQLSSPRTMTSSIPSVTTGHRRAQVSSSEFNATMITETSHLNELQKENRAPPLPPPYLLPASSADRSTVTNSSISSLSSALSNTTSTFENCQV